MCVALPSAIICFSAVSYFRILYDQVLKLFFDEPVLFLEFGSGALGNTSRCFSTLIAGQTHVYSSHQIFGRSSYLRTLRNHIHSRLTLFPSEKDEEGWQRVRRSSREDVPTEMDMSHQRSGYMAHRILACPKNVRSAIVSAVSEWSSLCGDVEAAGRRFHPHAHMRCFDPSEAPIVEQVRAAAAATVIVAHHGTVPYIALFARDGAALVTVGSQPLKDAHVLLWTTHIHVFYLHATHVNRDLVGILLLAQCRAADSLNAALSIAVRARGRKEGSGVQGGGCRSSIITDRSGRQGEGCQRATVMYSCPKVVGVGESLLQDTT